MASVDCQHAEYAGGVVGHDPLNSREEIKNDKQKNLLVTNSMIRRGGDVERSMQQVDMVRIFHIC